MYAGQEVSGSRERLVDALVDVCLNSEAGIAKVAEKYDGLQEMLFRNINQEIFANLLADEYAKPKIDEMNFEQISKLADIRREEIPDLAKIENDREVLMDYAKISYHNYNCAETYQKLKGDQKLDEVLRSGFAIDYDGLAAAIIGHSKQQQDIENVLQYLKNVPMMEKAPVMEQPIIESQQEEEKQEELPSLSQRFVNEELAECLETEGRKYFALDNVQLDNADKQDIAILEALMEQKIAFDMMDKNVLQDVIDKTDVFTDARMSGDKEEVLLLVKLDTAQIINDYAKETGLEMTAKFQDEQGNLSETFDNGGMLVIEMNDTIVPVRSNMEVAMNMSNDEISR